MKTRNPDAKRVRERNLSPEPESMQKYSDEVRERIAKKAYELYEQRGATGGARPGRLAESRRTGPQGDE
jgi:hypothetical protein